MSLVPGTRLGPDGILGSLGSGASAGVRGWTSGEAAPQAVQPVGDASPAGAIMRVGAERGALWAATTPTLLIKEGDVTVLGGSPGRLYDISADGQRFLMIKAGGGSGDPAAPISLLVVQHFDEELKRLVPGT